MRWTRVPAAAFLTAAMTATLVAVGAPAAHAAETSCSTDIADEAIVGDLVVPAGANCTIGGATVDGNVIVNAGGWLDATDATINGDVTGTDAYGILIDGTTVGGKVVSYSAGSEVGFLYLIDLHVGGNVETGGIDVEISDSVIDGSLSTLAATYVDLLRTSVAGDVSIADSDFGASVAGAVVTGSLSVTGSSRDVLLGATTDGAADQWGNTVGGNLILTENTANLQVSGTTVLGAIQLTANTPAANFGPGNVVSGGVTGEHTGPAPGAGAGEGDQPVVVVVPEPDAGEFTWTVDSASTLVNLGVAVENGDHFAAAGGLNPVRVTDTRLNAPQWAVTAQLSDFSAGAGAVSGKYLGWTPTVLENDGGAVAGAPVESGFISGNGLSVSSTLGSAAAGHARGSALLGADLALKLPVSVGAGTYNATLTLTALS